MSDVRTSLGRSGLPGSSGAADLWLSYPAFGNQLPRTREQAWREGVIYTKQAQAHSRKALLMLDDISSVRERRQFCDQNPRVDAQPALVASGRPQDSGLNSPALERQHERRGYLVKLVDKDVGATEQPVDRRILPQRPHDDPRADTGKQFDAFRPFQNVAGPVRYSLQRRRNERLNDLVGRFEVIIEGAMCNVRLLGDVVDGRTIDSLAPENELGRSEDGFPCPLASTLIAVRNCRRVVLDDFGRHLSSEQPQQAKGADTFVSSKPGRVRFSFRNLSSGHRSMPFNCERRVIADMPFSSEISSGDRGAAVTSLMSASLQAAEDIR
jgi:hypothetical protein